MPDRDPVQASRDAMEGSAAEHWHYHRPDPLEGIGLLRLALLALALIPLFETAYQLRRAWRQRKD